MSVLGLFCSVFTHHAFIAFAGNQLAASLSTFAILFPSIGFLLAVVRQKDVYVIGFHRLSHIEFRFAQHVCYGSMNMLQYSICLWVLNTGWLMLNPICIA
jgi:hypothetical protein